MSEVKISNIIKKFGDVKAVDNFNITVKQGEFVSILGPSGCGKTTMLRMVAGFEKATDGEISIGDRIVTSKEKNIFLPPEKRNIGMVFQSYAVWPHMNVFDNVAYPLKIKKLPKNVIKEKVDNALQIVHLSQYADRFPNQLSGGQQQRVALGRALVAEPGLLLLDEPLSNLDAKLRENMRFEIKDIQKKLNITVIYVTHDQGEAMAMSDRIVVMNQGVIQQIDEPIKIYEQPKTQFVADFIGKVNFLKAVSDGNKITIPSLNYEFSKKSDIIGNTIIAVRPENISIDKDGKGLKGKIINTSYLGDSADLRVDIGDKIIRVIGDSYLHKELNDCNEVYINFNNVIVFKDDGSDKDIKITT